MRRDPPCARVLQAAPYADQLRGAGHSSRPPALPFRVPTVPWLSPSLAATLHHAFDIRLRPLLLGLCTVCLTAYVLRIGASRAWCLVLTRRTHIGHDPAFLLAQLEGFATVESATDEVV